MTLGIMQPYFFPYLGYFDLINRCDRWVVFDVVRYGRRTWMNRNRILDQGGGWQYLSVPVEKPQSGALIHEVRVQDKDAVHKSLRGKLGLYREHAPHYRAVLGILDETFASAGDSLVSLNVSSLASVCRYLKIDFRPIVYSERTDRIRSVAHAGHWALEIAQQLEATQYLNPPGGREIFDPVDFEQAGIELRFSDPPRLRYDTGPFPFEENLSILDVLMWCEPAAVRSALEANRSRYVDWQTGESLEAN